MKVLQIKIYERGVSIGEKIWGVCVNIGLYDKIGEKIWNLAISYHEGVLHIDKWKQENNCI